MDQVILLISCPDQKGITAAVTDFVFRLGGNIVDADQHTDKQDNVFFMRIAWELEGFSVPREQLGEKFRPLAEKFSMAWELYFTDEVTRVALFVSKHLHCLNDLLFRYKAGQLKGKVELIVSNHLDAEPLARQAGIEFLHTPVTPATKHEAETRQLQALKAKGIELVVLARYHQILTGQFIRAFNKRVINIHHSFLPAFVGGSPYAQAFQKGVKIIGATSHYVIEDLDQGPIIEQDTARVNHKHSIEDLVHKGQDLERVVLYRALRWHLEHKVLCYGNKTVVFE
ncbi:MAG: formyltetrahydrofolate deformylase [Candidatus Omnitrophica bacterium]|nr:formyltetrahydrofolate deformylase [Candidatus Omnitrophota bacterium]